MSRLFLALSSVLVMAAAPMPAATSGTSSATDTGNICTLVPAEVVRTLLFDAAGGTLDSWTVSSPRSTACNWAARPSGGGAVRRLHLELSTAGSDAEVSKAVQGGMAASPALPPGSDDQIVWLGDDGATAVHGRTIATLDASQADIADAAAARYWIDAGALAAAGGQVRPPPAAKTADTNGDTSASNAIWTPPPHDPGSIGRIAAPLVATLAFLASWRFPMLPAFIVLGVAIGAIGKRVGAARLSRYGVVALGAFAIYNVVFGTSMADRLVYGLGTSAAATITDSFATSTQYNSHNVVGYHVLIRRTAGGVVRTSFQDDDFNVYPPHNATSYPSVGDSFTVRYPPGFPATFVIVADDNSPWATGLRCGALNRAAAAAQRDLDFAPADNRSRAAAAAAQSAVRRGGC